MKHNIPDKEPTFQWAKKLPWCKWIVGVDWSSEGGWYGFGDRNRLRHDTKFGLQETLLRWNGFKGYTFYLGNLRLILINEFLSLEETELYFMSRPVLEYPECVDV